MYPIGRLVYSGMPKLWNETIQSHRSAVRDAIVDSTIQLIEQQGLLSVTMSGIAERTGIGRATLYKYFGDVESILLAWLERHIDAHLVHLAEVRDRATDPWKRLAGVLQEYALIAYRSREHRGSRLAAMLHSDERIARRERELHEMLRELLSQAAHEGVVRDDVSPSELASYCLGALGAARALSSDAAVRRLVNVTLSGLQAGNPATQQKDT